MVRMAFEEFVSQLPLPTILLRWNLRLVYQNAAAREFCTMWEKGPEQGRLIKAHSPIPPEILDRCRQLKQEWTELKLSDTSHSALKEEHVHHPHSPHLRATIQLRQLNSAGVVQPHFLIECQDLRGQTASPPTPKNSQYFIGLTRRERAVAGLVCEGRSNQEVADEAGMSLATVKRHVHAIFHKLEITSRSRLIALTR
jgi:DNA-binding NarL/FixJ family response regulator